MIRVASARDTEEIRRLWDEAFPEEPEFNDWFFANRYCPDTCLVLCEDGIIKAMAQQLCYHIKNMGEVSYIYGAATKKEYRRRGLMGNLLKYSFDLDRKKGRVASILIPQNKPLFEYYSLLGYEKVFYVKSGFFDGCIEKTDGFELKSAGEKDILFMDRLYSHGAGADYIIRSYEYWQEQINMFRSLSGEVFILMKNGEACGYAFYNGDFVQEIFSDYMDVMLSLLCENYGRGLKYVTSGGDTPIGMMYSYHKPAENKCYLNLMFN